jgi:hypothetical protein
MDAQPKENAIGRLGVILLFVVFAAVGLASHNAVLSG